MEPNLQEEQPTGTIEGDRRAKSLDGAHGNPFLCRSLCPGSRRDNRTPKSEPVLVFRYGVGACQDSLAALYLDVPLYYTRASHPNRPFP